MDRDARSVQEMVEMLHNMGGGGEAQEKQASAGGRAPARAAAPEAAQNEVAQRLLEDYSQEAITSKIASAQVSGKIMAEMIDAKLASSLPALIHEVVKVAVAQALREAGITKAATGTSSTIPTGTTTGTQKPDEGADFRALALKADREGVDGFSSRTEKYINNDTIEGAQVSGGGGPNASDRPGGNMPDGFQSAGKFAALARKVASTRSEISNRRAFLRLNSDRVSVKQASTEAQQLNELEQKLGSIEDDMAMYQQLQQKQASGQPLSPDEQQQLAMLEQKLGAYLQQAQGGQGGGAPAGGGGGDPMAGGGAPPKQASAGNGGMHPALALLQKAGLYNPDQVA